MRDSPALNSAVLALFAVVPGARYSAAEIPGHVPALNRSPYCNRYPITGTLALHLSTKLSIVACKLSTLDPTEP